MAKSQNPVESFRREQKKKEAKKLKYDRQKSKFAKLATLEPEQLKPELNRLKRQLELDPKDGHIKKKKNELESILSAAMKKKTESKSGQMDTSSGIKTSEDLKTLNENRYKDPKNSIHYHPTLNPYGAPPPGHPQMYHTSSPHPLPSTHSNPSSIPQRASIRNRPLAPSDPPPPSSIQVPRRPPLPAGAVPIQAPPPPPLPMRIPTSKDYNDDPIQIKATKPPMPPPIQPLEAPKMEESDVIAPYPQSASTHEDREDREGKRLEGTDAFQETVAFLPTSIRVHRKKETRKSTVQVSQPNITQTDEKLKDFLDEINTLRSE